MPLMGKIGTRLAAGQEPTSRASKASVSDGWTRRRSKTEALFFHHLRDISVRGRQDVDVNMNFNNGGPDLY